MFLFDCDQTIWTSGDNDYISSLISPLMVISKYSIIRIQDGKVFSLKPGIEKIFEYIKESGNIVGIISDNNKNMVIGALKLFGLYQYINTNAINIKLWRGYCPKHLMLAEILEKPVFLKITSSNVYWFDDKDYTREAKLIKVNFIKVDNFPDIKELIK